MSQHATSPAAGAAPSPVEEAAWRDDPDYPHRIENHVKVYLHVPEAPAGRSPQWCVSKVTVDGLPLDGSEDGHYCDYEGHPLGARPDWDHQHQAAEKLDLPTAGELFPMLEVALSASYVDPIADRLAAAREVIDEHDAWQTNRQALSAAEATGDGTTPSAWHQSDDMGCELADRAVALLAELTGQSSPTSESSPNTPSGTSLMRSMLEATPATSATEQGPSTPTSHKPSGPAR